MRDGLYLHRGSRDRGRRRQGYLRGSAAGDAGCSHEARKKKGVAERIEPYNCSADHIGAHENVDLAVAMWSVHEMPDQKRFVEQVAATLRSGGKFLIAEPRFHVTENDMKNSIEICAQAGLRLADKPRIGLSLAALLIKE